MMGALMLKTMNDNEKINKMKQSSKGSLEEQIKQGKQK